MATEFSSVRSSQSWPERCDFAAFRRHVGPHLEVEMFGRIFAQHHHELSVKKESVALQKLRSLVHATFTLANRGGFHAMSLRELCKQAGLSMGGMYAYIRSKDDLVRWIQSGLRDTVGQLLEAEARREAPCTRRLAWVLRAHLYVSELLQPWFYFSFMEARHFAAGQKRFALASERATEALIEDLMRQAGYADAPLKAAFCKALLQDWYLKRGKYKTRGIDVDAYADGVLATITH